MKELKIMLCCGAGMSSGMLAKKARKAAQKRGMEIEIAAKSESEVHHHFQNIDLLFLGPHFASHQEQFQRLGKPFGVPVLVIPRDIYGMLDGEKLIDLALETLKDKA